MKPYTSPDSGVIAYEYWKDWISVKFNTWKIYTYTYQSAWAANIEEMKRLANQNDWLNSFIMTHVKKNYASIS